VKLKRNGHGKSKGKGTQWGEGVQMKRIKNAKLEKHQRMIFKEKKAL